MLVVCLFVAMHWSTKLHFLMKPNPTKFKLLSYVMHFNTNALRAGLLELKSTFVK